MVPGSTSVRRESEQLGLDRIFLDAGFEWGEAGCSMCAGVNGEEGAPGERIVSTTNRNFAGRQGAGVMTHLASPETAAAAALAGCLVDRRGGPVMRQFKPVDAPAALLDRDNIDTDQVLPAAFLRGADPDYRAGLFALWRRDPAFVLSRPGWEHTAILVSGANFGCGSTREHACWALDAFGIRVLIAGSFGEVFRDNCVRNAILPIAAAPEPLEAAARPAARGARPGAGAGGSGGAARHRPRFRDGVRPPGRGQGRAAGRAG